MSGFMWTIRKGFWNWLATFKYRGNKPVHIPVPSADSERLEVVPLRTMTPDVPIENIPVANRVPKDEAQPPKQYFYRFQLLMFRWFPATQPGLPSIDADPNAALQVAYDARHQALFPQPVRMPAFDGPDDALLATLAVEGPFAGYIEKSPNGGFQWDLREPGNHEHLDGLHKLGVHVSFDVDETTRRPRARRIESVLGMHQPGDPDWSEAVRLALCTASTDLSLIRHFCWTHLIASPALAVATRNTLPAEHPLRRLVWPHVYGTQCTTSMTIQGQMVPGGEFPDIFSLTHRGMCSLFTASYPKYRFAVLDPAADARRRGIAGAGFDTPSQDNLQALFDVFHAHATRYVEAYYPDDITIANDDAVVAWLAALTEMIPNGIDTTATRAGVARLVAAFIYMASVQHEVFGGGVWDYQLWTDRIPARVYRDGRREPIDVYQRLVNANFNLNIHRAKLMQDFSYMALDQKGRDLFGRFLEDLRALDDSMAALPQTPWLIRPSRLEANINA